VGSGGVVMVDVGRQSFFDVASVPDQGLVETFGAYRSDPAFGVGVRSWSLDRGLDDQDAFVGEDVVEAAGELGVPVPDEKSVRPGVAIAELVGEVSGLLGDPGGGGVGGDAGEPDVAAVEFDEEQDVQPGHSDGVRG